MWVSEKQKCTGSNIKSSKANNREVLKIAGEIHLLYVDLGNAFDRIIRNTALQCLEERNVDRETITAVKGEENRSYVRTRKKASAEFETKIFSR